MLNTKLQLLVRWANSDLPSYFFRKKFYRTTVIPDIISRFHSLDKEKERTRKEQSFLVPKADIVANDYDLSINKYKEVERVKVVYDDPEVVLGRLENLQNQLAEAMVEYKTIVKKTSE